MPAQYSLAQDSLVQDSLVQGKQLALIYCSSCHLFPDPSLLDKDTWVNNVLPNMAWRLGIREKGYDPYTDVIPEERARSQGRAK